MDEIVIDERKYISSKRAAKATGYAKDYIGQLCREGRVTARFVGRSWYVLESALQDHRFGNQKDKNEIAPAKKGTDTEVETTEIKKAEVKAPVMNWDLPRYKVTTDENILPVIQRENAMEDVQVPDLNTSWENWVDIVKNPAVLDEASEQEEIGERTGESPLVIKETEEPIVHRYGSREVAERPIRAPRASRSYRRAFYRLIRVMGVSVAVISLLISSISNGLFDTYIASFTQASVISGISVYIKHSK